MDNPWVRLREHPPYVLECDKELVDAFIENDKRNEINKDYRIHTDSPPVPYIGNLEGASIVLLTENPGYGDEEAEKWRAKSVYIDLHLKNLRQDKGREYPFYVLDPKFDDAPGNEYWYGKLKWLIDESNIENVSKKVCCIEYFPYHSHLYKHHPLVPSQKYGFQLVREAIRREAIIVILRGKRVWGTAVPELTKLNDHHHIYHSNNPRNPTVSPGNIQEEGGYEEILRVLRE